MPFKKGQSGNPGGRSTEKPFYDALRMEMAKNYTPENNAYRQLARKLMAAASNGEAWAIKELIDRLDGKPLQQTENVNMNEHTFVSVPETLKQDEWLFRYSTSPADQSGKRKPARNGH